MVIIIHQEVLVFKATLYIQTTHLALPLHIIHSLWIHLHMLPMQLMTIMENTLAQLHHLYLHQLKVHHLSLLKTPHNILTMEQQITLPIFYVSFFTPRFILVKHIWSTLLETLTSKPLLLNHLLHVPNITKNLVFQNYWLIILLLLNFLTICALWRPRTQE